MECGIIETDNDINSIGLTSGTMLERLSLLERLAWCALVLFFLAQPVRADPALPFSLPDKRSLGRLRSAVIETSQGTLFLELYPEEAPYHVANFKYLADSDFYQGLTFHRYVPGYIIQGGDPKGTGYGGPGYLLPAEFSRRKHRLGTVGMLRKPDLFGSDGRPINPGRLSNGSQFYIALDDASNMDGKYTIFGQVVDGINVLRKLRDGDRIERVKVFVRE